VNPWDRDVVYIVKAAEANEELRHSLRTVAANMPHRNVWIVGYRPRWISADVGYVSTLQRGPKHSNTWANWVTAALHPEISDEFTLMNDDFFITRRIDDVPPLHRGPLDDMVRWYGQNRLVSHRTRSAFTRQALERIGRPAPHLSYELHTPLVVNRHVLTAGIDSLASRGLAGHQVAKRTFYGNLAQLGGEHARDVKVQGPKEGLPETPTAYLSTSPHSWAGLAGGWVRKRFGAPCRYERLPSDRMYRPPTNGAARGA